MVELVPSFLWCVDIVKRQLVDKKGILPIKTYTTCQRFSSEISGGKLREGWPSHLAWKTAVKMEVVVDGYCSGNGKDWWNRRHVMLDIFFSHFQRAPVSETAGDVWISVKNIWRSVLLKIVWKHWQSYFYPFYEITKLLSGSRYNVYYFKFHVCSVALFYISFLIFVSYYFSLSLSHFSGNNARF